MDKDSKGLIYIVKAFMIAIVFVGVLHAISPLFVKPDPLEPQVKELTQKIVPLRASAVPAMLMAKDDKPVMMVVYASWCGYCKIVLPQIANMIRRHQLDGVEPLFLSMDTRFISLSKYLVHNRYEDLMVPPYVVKQSGIDSLMEVLKGTGSSFSGYIPYIGFFDRQGKMIAESHGMVDKEKLKQIMTEIKTR